MKKQAFTIPLQSEVHKYIRDKKGWPMPFCVHYGDKFWNHYQASGWKLSSGNAVKDWKACFNAQWQTLKFKEDIELLNSMTGGMAKNVAKVIETDFDRLDAFIDSLRKSGVTTEFSDYGKWYDFMKSYKLILPMTKDEIDWFLKVYNGDKQRCRCAAVKKTLDHYVIHGIRIKDIIGARNRLNDRAGSPPADIRNI